MQLVDRKRVQELLGRDEVLGCARGRRPGLQPGIGRQQREVGGVACEVDHLRGGCARVHLLLVQRPDVVAEVRATGRVAEHVGGHVDPVRPDAELRVVAEAAGRLDRVEVPAAVDRVAGLRNGEALEHVLGIDVPRAIELEGKVGEHPPVLEAVIEDDRVAEVVRVTKVAEAALAHEGVERERRDPGPAGLVVNPDRDVDRLDVVRRAHVSVRIRRVTLAPVREVEPLEGRARRRGGRVDHLAPLDDLRQLRSGAGRVLEPLSGAAAGEGVSGGCALRAFFLDDLALQLPDVEDLAVSRLQVQLARVGALDRLRQVPAHGRAVLERLCALSAAGHRGLQRRRARDRHLGGRRRMCGRARRDDRRDRSGHQDRGHRDPALGKRPQSFLRELAPAAALMPHGHRRAPLFGPRTGPDPRDSV